MRIKNVSSLRLFLAISTTLIIAGLASCSSKKVVSEQTVIPLPSPLVQEDLTSGTERPSRAPREAIIDRLPTAHFSFDSAKLSKRSKKRIHDQVRLLKKSDQLQVLVIGGCDERGSLKYNDALGLKRAYAVKAEMIRLGIKSSRISIRSVGERAPVALGHNEEAWAKNRRSEMHVTLRNTIAYRRP
jgi:peptidoglycan-associated lipoprotein